MLRATLKKYWIGKKPGCDGMHGFWFKQFMSIHDRLAIQLSGYLEANIPKGMTKGKTILIQKGSQKGTIPNNYRPIMCLLRTGKILMAQIREEIYFSLICCGLFQEEQKGCHNGTRGVDDLLYIDQHILKESKVRQKNVVMVLDWLQKALLCGLANLDSRLSQNVEDIPQSHKIHHRSHEKWKVELTAGGKTLAEVKIQSGIFQDVLSPFPLFVIAMMSLRYFRSAGGGGGVFPTNLQNTKKWLITLCV